MAAAATAPESLTYRVRKEMVTKIIRAAPAATIRRANRGVVAVIIRAAPVIPKAAQKAARWKARRAAVAAESLL